MKAAFVIMSILGCDDSGVQCHAVASVTQQWQTIALCDAASDAVLDKYRNVNYPMVVAVCQTADTTALADSQDDATENAFSAASHPTPQVPAAVVKHDMPGLMARAIALVKYAIPTRKGLKSTLTMPVHIVTDTYSWVARKVTD